MNMISMISMVGVCMGKLKSNFIKAEDMRSLRHAAKNNIGSKWITFDPRILKEEDI